MDAERHLDELDALVGDDDDAAIAAITASELLVGVALARGKRRIARQMFVDAVMEALPVLPYDLNVARAHVQLLVAVRRSGRPRGAHDLIIAATAVSTRRIVLTADATGFADLPEVDVRQH